MKCKNFKEQIILLHYNELGDKERVGLEGHIKECPDCAEDFAYTKKVFQILAKTRVETMPEADWKKSWQRIDSHIQQKPQSKKKFFLFPRWTYATVVVLIIFIAGVIIGRFWLASAGGPTIGLKVSQAYVDQSLQKYLEDLGPVMVEYANYSPTEKSEGTIVMDKRVARSLLLQNLLLRNIIAKTQPSLLSFLDDVDLVLKEISNLDSDDTRTPFLIRDLIHEREILFKMEILKTL